MEPQPKRRKIRKGTHSCWECRRRKVKCIFEDESDAVCKPCAARDTECVSQEFATVPAAAAATTDGGLSGRLSRLERMMERFLEQNTSSPPQNEGFIPSPSETQSSVGVSQDPSPPVPQAVDPMAPFHDPELDVLDPSISKDNSRELDCSQNIGFSFPAQPPFSDMQCLPSDAAYIPVPQWNKYATISEQIHSYFPPPKALEILAQQSFGAPVVLASLSSKKNPAENTPEPITALTCPPPPTSHPALLAKRLVQLAFCLQHLPSTINVASLGLTTTTDKHMGSASQIAESWVTAAATLVTGNDSLVHCIEGVECLLHQSLFYIDAGQFRKAWMAGRRAINTGQLLGLDHRSQVFNKNRVLPSCNPSRGPAQKPRSEALWWRLNCNDRYLSIMLGLPIGSKDNSFAAEAYTAGDAPEVRLGKAYTVITGKVADRNDAAALGNDAEAYALTQAIDLDLERAAQVMKTPWWRVPNITARGGHATPCGAFEFDSSRDKQQQHQADEPGSGSGAADETVTAAMTLKIQVRHYSLLILTHLPYLLRDGEGRRYEYNRTTCMQASRAVLERFLSFRAVFLRTVSGRAIDYAGLIAAATLMLGHLGQRRRQRQQRQRSDRDDNRDPGVDDVDDEIDTPEWERDRDLAEAYRDKMCELAALNKDRMAAEAAETIAQLVPLAMGTNEASSQPVCSPMLASACKTSLSDPSNDPLHSLLLSCGPQQDGSFSIVGDCAMASTVQQLMIHKQGTADWSGDIDNGVLQDIAGVFWSVISNSMG